ncbi:MAG: cytochrome C biogenesis protein [Verrucomicrobia bacterium]|nr:MAG: cytochrome C biogenesis protein [Verrucomicrobiota bacterium]
MKKLFPWLLTGALALWVLAGMMPPKDPGAFHSLDFARLPVVANGRLQPIDSVARNSLLIMRTRRSVSFEETGADGQKHRRRLAAIDWLMELMMKPKVADTRPVFRIDHPQLKDLLGLPGDEKAHYFSWKELEPKLAALDREARRAMDIDAKKRSRFENAAVHLHQALILYQRLKNTLVPEEVHDFAADLEALQEAAGPGLKAFAASHGSRDFDQQALQKLALILRRYESSARMAYPLMIPPADPQKDPEGWKTVGDAVLEPVRAAITRLSAGDTNAVPERLEWQPQLLLFARMASAYRNGDAGAFNAALDEYRQWLDANMPAAVAKGRHEHLYNHWELFYRATVIYVLAFLFGCLTWFADKSFRTFNLAALLLLALGLAAHSGGMFFRMALENRPPVTNLYSSAVFVGWGSVVLGLLLELKFRNSVGVVMAAAVGFVTQIIAFNLSESGDTMEMMRAVLDSNFWLATHVVTITIGYSAMFVAGALAILYVVRGVFTRSLDPRTRRNTESMVYGIICFATLFSFVGTILGGIWADQSWGRFWGWDPKENGALLIVLWCAVILHARWAGLVKGPGLMALAIGGNIVTSFSWFGVNMLGIGLHSYGFMDSAFRWLVMFVASQLVLIALALLPTRYWASYRTGETDPPLRTPRPAPSPAKG